MSIEIFNDEIDTIKGHAKKIIDSIAEGNYNQISNLVDDMCNWDISFVEETIENFKKDNGISHIDSYEVDCIFNPTYKDGSVYKQEDIFCVKDIKYKYEYQLTTDGMPNDLVLQLLFKITSDRKLEVIFDSGITVL